MNKIKNFLKIVLNDLWSNILKQFLIGTTVLCTGIGIIYLVGYLVSIYFKEVYEFKHYIGGCYITIILIFVIFWMCKLYKYLYIAWLHSDD